MHGVADRITISSFLSPKMIPIDFTRGAELSLRSTVRIVRIVRVQISYVFL